MENNIQFILTHPNGWEGLQQQQIRRAAEIAGLIPGGDEHAARIHLLTEGEASLHFCVTHVLASDSLSNIPIVQSDDPEEDVGEESENQGIIVIDAGGGTIDLSAYSVRLSPPREFKEIAPAECNVLRDRLKPFLKRFLHRSSSRFCVCHAKSPCVHQRCVLLDVVSALGSSRTVTAKLANSRYGSDEIVEQMKDIFDKTTKLRFRDANDPQYIKFGTVRDKEPQYDIRSGQLKLAG